MLPRSARAYVCLVTCAELWRRHQPVGECCGLDMRRFDRLAPPNSATARSIPLWQFSHTALTNAVCWCDSLLTAIDVELTGRASLRALSDGRCHAVCCWIDFSYDVGKDASPGLITSTGPAGGPDVTQSGQQESTPLFGPSPWTQGIVLLDTPLQATAGELLQATLSLDIARGGQLEVRLVKSTAA